MRIKSIRVLEEKQPVYNLEVEETHNFIGENGIIFHNCYDSLGYGLISFHQRTSKPLWEDTRTREKRHKDRLARNVSRRRRGRR